MGYTTLTLTTKQKNSLKTNMFNKIEHLGIAVSDMQTAIKEFESIIDRRLRGGGPERLTIRESR